MHTQLHVLSKKETLFIRREEAKRLTELITTYQQLKETQTINLSTLRNQIEKERQKLATHSKELKTKKNSKYSQLQTEINTLKQQNRNRQYENELLSQQVANLTFFSSSLWQE
jgi:chromosome segregation ATPase